jgi:putative intracellular protease/amidase
MIPYKILFVVTSAATMGDGGEPTGLWFEELATPYYAFVDQGADVDIVSTAGGAVPIDPRSKKPKGENPASVDRFMGDATASAKIADTKSIADIDTSGYDAVFLPGGHGTMWDLPASKPLASTVVDYLERGKVVAAVCHGPAGLVSAKFADGTPVVAGKRVTAFTNSEEVAAGLDKAVPFFLEDRLRELGAKVETAADFKPFSIRDGNLITGQNPASSAGAAKLTLEALNERAPAAAGQ